MQSEKRIEKALAHLQITDLKDMQQVAVQTIAKEKDTLLLSPTGSGKTLAFLLPILEKLDRTEKNIQCLILTPSRELALQIEQVWKKMATGFKVNSFYGGHDMQTEIHNLSALPALLIGTPGRISDHINRETFDCTTIKTLVLDEFDKSLALGFHEEMSFIISKLTGLEKRVLVSATYAEEIPEFTGVVNPVVIDYITQKPASDALEIKIVASEEKDKIDTLFRLLCYLNEGATLIFTNHREAAERISTLLHERDIETACFHGGMEQMQREQTLVQFRNGTYQFLVATDLAARGLDIAEVKHVVHYHLPGTAEEFTHRNGRTARMDAHGTAYVILHNEEALPDYITGKHETLNLPESSPLPGPTPWTTIFINAGKKDKINKTDIVGFLSQKGQLGKDDLGLIEVKDHVSFAAVKKQRVKTMLQLVREEKMKGKKYILKIAR